MDNSSYRSLYIEEAIKNVADQSASTVSVYWLRIGKIEHSIGKRLESGYTKDEYTSLLNALNVTNLNAFYVNKSRIGAYIKWLIQRDLLPPDSINILTSIKYSEMRPDRIFDTKYFESFDSLQDAIETTLFAAERIDDAVYALQISSLYLAWCGLTIEEALAVKKADVLEDCIIVGDRRIYPEPKIMAYLIEFRDATQYTTQGKGVITRRYPYSEYLFRTAQSYHVTDPKTMRVFIRTFGVSGGEENIYNYDKVYWSGIFKRTYDYECKHGKLTTGNMDVLEELFRETYPTHSAAYKRLAEYQQFREYFYPSK